MTRALKALNIFYQKKFLFIATLIILSCIITIIFDRFFAHDDVQMSFECNSTLVYINPYPDCETYLEKIENFENLQENLEALVLELESKSGISRVSVFSRDLKTRRFVGVNDNERFFMASLLKVPLMVAWYKLAEVEPKILQTSIIYRGVPDLYWQQTIAPKEKLLTGQKYSLDELIERTIIYSDNTSAQILADNLPKEMIDRILSALNIQVEREVGVYENYITAKSYAGVFRILYNSSYLTRFYSNKSLELLSNSDFNEGMRSVVKSGVKIASKFGERTTIESDGSETKQLHECGIVYNNKGKEPYTFCILTEGKDYKELVLAIKTISKQIYEAND